MVESIKAFLPYRNEAIELFEALAMYLDTPETRRILHRFFERLIPYLFLPQHITSYRDGDVDNFRFIVHELFLYAVACMIRHERFESAAYLMGTPYYAPENWDYGREGVVPYSIFRQYTQSLEYRNTRLALRRLSVHADLLKERCVGVDLEFRHLLQADFVLFMRMVVDRTDNRYIWWWPETLVWLKHASTPFEVFARSRSAAYFEDAKILLGVKSKDALTETLQSLSGTDWVPRWQFQSLNPASLLGLDKLATEP